MTGVATIAVDEVFIPLSSDFHAFPIYGQAEISANGHVTGITFHGYRDGAPGEMTLTETPKRHATDTFNERLFVIAADAIERQCRNQIADALSEWRESIREREYEPAE